MGHIKARIQLTSPKDVKEFVDIINSTDTVNEYIFENATCDKVADARSYLGAMYASSDFKVIYLVNKTHDGIFPPEIDQFRA